MIKEVEATCLGYVSGTSKQGKPYARFMFSKPLNYSNATCGGVDVCTIFATGEAYQEALKVTGGKLVGAHATILDIFNDGKSSTELLRFNK